MIVWKEQPNLSSVVAMRGELAVGAIFTSSGAYTRWRAWMTKNANPSEGTARNATLAKAEVEKRFEEFLKLAKLKPAD